ncbi:type I-F CRISPR-associated protein Csy3 [Pigmentibacter sp. JX0631]|uniref:type I-F CRISPR-associated protein Csy3 n=1 Tax=Pigmentibacter sp. JX0631 TaxID=2976982 RepID=UPI0024689982|nr:type I-F CRISPR-associated protein Csy3 [Pigmentibacter sp. JX0631]WGL59727.1 type I-F CRISPR-associated protein Csy3 [Pigmentibacter sp. JX0631]
MSKKEIKTASVLAFERKLSNSDAIMSAGKWQNIENSSLWEPIQIQEKSVRGTISNRLSSKNEEDPLKLNASIQNANLQRVDYACLPFNTDTLKIEFTVRILNNVYVPTTCNNPSYQEVFTEKIQEYIKEYSFKELSLRYAENIANGRFLWRNRLGADNINIRVTQVSIKNENSKVWNFNAYDYNLKNFQSSPTDQLKSLAEVINNGFKNDTYTGLKVEAFIKLGEGQEIFPSQELVLDNDKNSAGRKSKYLYSVSGVVAMHSQKIGNALRTIDTWYPNMSEPISVEPYGSVTNRGIAFRQPKENMDFYSLFDNWIVKNIEPKLEQKHFIIAMLIRGGVFGGSDK